ncbi:hypothetical protein [Ferrovibrio terrae]|uniref:hypothetical protein n=1 Tax=Ferrovibrio terrae TaxID=2594003 RepID=UPI003137910B
MSIGGGPKAPDTSAQDKAAADAKAEKDKLKRENDAKLKARRGRSSGRGLLTTFGEAGVSDLQNTLG